MVAKLADIAGLPYWPRFLSREQAAAYLGVSPSTFDEEVRGGIWPQGRHRGRREGRVTWDRAALDRAADQDTLAVGEDDYDKRRQAWERQRREAGEARAR